MPNCGRLRGEGKQQQDLRRWEAGSEEEEAITLWLLGSWEMINKFDSHSCLALCGEVRSLRAIGKGMKAGDLCGIGKQVLLVVLASD